MMAKVEIVRSLILEIKKRFDKAGANCVIDLMESLEKNPKKGKLLGSVGGIAIKEIQYRQFRFYFITDGFRLKMMDEESLVDLLLRFVRMSDKKHQQQTIDEIRNVLRKVGPKGFV